ncbi:MAG: hypothetical protein HKO65_20590 [Gemmatimonadetes bacterium]|nr:hypothetical protein [Gemmatimonadota bacterium]
MSGSFRPLIVLSVVVLAGASAAATLSSTHGFQGPDSNFVGQVKPVLYVADVRASAPYFRDVLGFDFHGFSETEGTPYYAEMSAGPHKFGLHMPLASQHETWVGHQRLYFRVKNVRTHRELVLSRGASAGDLVETDWMDFFIVRDSDGHEVVFAETDPTKHSIDPWEVAGGLNPIL